MAPAQDSPPDFSSGKIVDSYPIDVRIDIDRKTWDSAYGSIAKNSIAASQKSVDGGGGVQLSLIPAGTPATYARCRAQPYPTSTYLWTEVPSGSSICLRRTDRRVGQFRVVYKRTDEGRIEDLNLSGEVWEPT
ncbi:hypothetical protein GCM10029964_042090 [Kibdelosporangium lantanae]